MAVAEAAVLFGACLEAYQHAQAQEAEASEDAEFPALDWEGWREVAKLLGILDTSDAPMFRARQAVKIASAADAANLRGERVKFDAVERRLCDILSGSAPLSQVPDTQAEDVLLRPARARIVLREKRHTGRGRATHHYEVLFHNHPREEGNWLSQSELKRHFPDSWQQMVNEFEERARSGRLLEPSPADAEAAGVEDATEAAGWEQQGGRRQAPAVSAATAGGSRRSLSGAPERQLPVGPRNIPLESQPDEQTALYDMERGPPPSMLLAGINLQHQPPPQQAVRPPGSAARSVAGSAGLRSIPPAVQQQAAAAAAFLLPPVQQQQPLTCTAPPPGLPASHGPPPQYPRAPSYPAYGSGHRVEHVLPGGWPYLQPMGPPPVTAAGASPARSPAQRPQPPPGYVPREQRPQPPPGYVARVQRPQPPPGYHAAGAATAPQPARQLAAPRQPSTSPAHRHPSASPSVSGRSAATLGNSLLEAFRRKRPEEIVAAAPTWGAALGPPQPPPGWLLRATPAAAAAAAQPQPQQRRDWAPAAPVERPQPPPGWVPAPAATAAAQVQPLAGREPAPAVERPQPPPGWVPAPPVQLGHDQVAVPAAPAPRPQPPPGWVPAAELAKSPSRPAVPPPGPPQPAAPQPQQDQQAQQQQAQQRELQPQQPRRSGPSRRPGPQPSSGSTRRARPEEMAAQGGGQEPAAKRPRGAAAAAIGISAAVAAAVDAAVDAATAALQQSPAQAVRSPVRQPAGSRPGTRQAAAAAAEAARAAAAEQQPPVQQQGVARRVPAPQPVSGWQEPADEADLAFQQALPLVAGRFQHKAPTPSKLDPQGQLLPPGEEQQAQQQPVTAQEQQGQPAAPPGAAGGVVDATAGEDEFFDAAEELIQPGSSQEAAEGLPAAALDLRTQPDDMQWTNLHDEPADSLPTTQVVQVGDRSGQEGTLVVPDTEEEQGATLLVPAQQQQQQQPSGNAAPAAGAAGAAAAGSGKQGSGGEEVQGKEDQGNDDEDDDGGVQLAARFKEGTIRGAKSTASGVELWVEWADGSKAQVPAARLHDLAHNDCPGCCVLSKLSQFYESKTRTQPKKRSSSRR